MINKAYSKIKLFINVLRYQGLIIALTKTKVFFLRRINIIRSRTLNLLCDKHIERGYVTGNLCISILMPVFNTPPHILESAICSVINQTYSNWELCICDDASTSNLTISVLNKYKGTDPRIKITTSPKNLHISNATNLAAKFATGQFVGFLDHDDVLSLDALENCVNALIDNPEADVLYSDEDKIEPDGSYSEPYFKPNWSPEHLLSVMYILHFMVVRKSLFLAVGCLREEYSGAQDFDLALRVTNIAREIIHIPKVLYHWRKIPGSAAAEVDAKPHALSNARRALDNFVQLNYPGSSVMDGIFHGSFRVDASLLHEPAVTLLILTDSARRDVDLRGDICLIENMINSIRNKTTYNNYKIIVIDNGKMPLETRIFFQRDDIEIYDYEFVSPFNYAKKANYALKFVRTENVILLNDDLEIISPDWIQALLGQSIKRDVGVTGCMLLYPNHKIQHAGVVLGVNGVSTHIFHNLLEHSIGYCGYTHLIRNYSAVTGAVLATRMSIVNSVGGFNESLAVDYNDIDFCLRVGAAGYRVVYTPHAKLYHFEGSTLVRKQANAGDQNRFLTDWTGAVFADPYYNPNLPKNRTDCFVTRW